MTDKIIRWAKLVYSSFPLARSTMKMVSASGPYYKITRARIKNQIAKEKTPFNLVLETSNFCNARCLMCPNPFMKREKKVMTEEVFKKIIERVRKEKLPINKVFFSGLGEPLIDPQIVQRMKAFKEMRLPVKLYSNAHLLTPEISRQLVDLKLEEINISFNGATPEHYQKVMGLDFGRTKENIENLLKIKKERESNFPKVLISSVLIGENEKDIKKHLENWAGKVDSVTVSLSHEWGGGIKVENCKLKIENLKQVYPCRSLWHTMMIDSSGNFVVCCRDYESSFVLGNVLTHSFSEVQRSPILESFRQAHMKFLEQKLPEMCRKCNFPFQDGIEWYLPRSID